MVDKMFGLQLILKTFAQILNGNLLTFHFTKFQHNRPKYAFYHLITELIGSVSSLTLICIYAIVPKHVKH